MLSFLIFGNIHKAVYFKLMFVIYLIIIWQLYSFVSDFYYKINAVISYNANWTPMKSIIILSKSIYYLKSTLNFPLLFNCFTLMWDSFLKIMLILTCFSCFQNSSLSLDLKNTTQSFS